MTQTLYKIDHIAPGTPLPFDAFDANGHLLLKKGFVVESSEQATRLIARGLFSSGSTAGGAAPRHAGSADGAFANPLFTTAAKSSHVERVSVHAMLDTCHQKLADVLENPPQDGTFAAVVREIATAVQRACDLDPDAALARNLVVRLRPHTTRHSLDCAILVDIVKRSSLPDHKERLALVCAALTMNLAAVAFHERCYAQSEPLSPAEKVEKMAHPARGAQKLRELGVDDADWISIVEQHHESPNGSGYPAGLMAKDIVPAALTLSIADRYCAMVSERAHRPGRNPGNALQELLLIMGKNEVDAAAASRFIREIGIYPPGAIVTLVNGEAAMVVSRTLNLKHPIVRAFTDSHGKPRPEYIKHATSDARFAIRSVVHPGETPVVFDLGRMWHPVTVEIDDQAGSDGC